MCFASVEHSLCYASDVTMSLAHKALAPIPCLDPHVFGPTGRIE